MKVDLTSQQLHSIHQILKEARYFDQYRVRITDSPFDDCICVKFRGPRGEPHRWLVSQIGRTREWPYESLATQADKKAGEPG